MTAHPIPFFLLETRQRRPVLPRCASIAGGGTPPPVPAIPLAAALANVASGFVSVFTAALQAAAPGSGEGFPGPPRVRTTLWCSAFFGCLSAGSVSSCSKQGGALTHLQLGLATWQDSPWLC